MKNTIRGMSCCCTEFRVCPKRFGGSYGMCSPLSVFLGTSGWVRSGQHPCASQRLPPSSHRSMDCPTTLLGVNLSDGRVASRWRDDAVQGSPCPLDLRKLPLSLQPCQNRCARRSVAVTEDVLRLKPRYPVEVHKPPKVLMLHRPSLQALISVLD